MDRYDVVDQIGEGTFGCVFLAVERSTGQKVRARVLVCVLAASANANARPR